MKYRHTVNVSWSSTQNRDEFKIQAVKDCIPHLIEMLFLSDEDAIGQDTSTIIQLVDTIETSADHLGRPVGITVIPVQMEVKKTRQLTVKIRIDQSLHQMLHTLAHEMEHVRQSYTADLVIGFITPTEHVNIWNGKAFSTKFFDYSDFPWERQAEEVAHEFMEDVLEDALSFSPL
ncbi:hypothetical protein NVP2275O_103 [Vibrio phage 2.275.O._10N.286.54.E11]|nr:hypothetical protein NVP2275O_103 [Vibrio phage 2.275.O._10N.286.54.E11]